MGGKRDYSTQPTGVCATKMERPAGRGGDDALVDARRLVSDSVTTKCIGGRLFFLHSNIPYRAAHQKSWNAKNVAFLADMGSREGSQWVMRAKKQRTRDRSIWTRIEEFV